MADTDATDLTVTSPPPPAPSPQPILLPQSVVVSVPPLPEFARGRTINRSPPGRRSRSPSFSRSERRKHRHKRSSRSQSSASSNLSRHSKHSTSSHKKHKKHKRHHRTYSPDQFYVAEGTTVGRSAHASVAQPAESATPNRRSAAATESPAHPSYPGSSLTLNGSEGTWHATSSSQTASQHLSDHVYSSSLASEHPDSQTLPGYFVVDLDNGGQAICETGLPSVHCVADSQVVERGGGESANTHFSQLHATNIRGDNHPVTHTLSQNQSSYPLAVNIPAATRLSDQEPPVLKQFGPALPPRSLSPSLHQAIQQSILSTLASFTQQHSNTPVYLTKAPTKTLSTVRNEPSATVTSQTLKRDTLTTVSQGPSMDHKLTSATVTSQHSTSTTPQSSSQGISLTPAPNSHSLPENLRSHISHQATDLSSLSRPGTSRHQAGDLSEGELSSSSSSSSASSPGRTNKVWSPFDEGAQSASFTAIRKAAFACIQSSAPHLLSQATEPAPQDPHFSLLQLPAQTQSAPSLKVAVPLGIARSRSDVLRSARGESRTSCPQTPQDPLSQRFPKPLRTSGFISRSGRNIVHPCDSFLNSDPLLSQRLQTSRQELEALGVPSFQPSSLSTSNFSLAISSSKFLASMEVALAAMQSMLFQPDDPKVFRDETSPSEVQTMFSFLGRLIEGAYEDSASLAFNAVLESRDSLLASAPSSFSPFQEPLRLAPMASDSLFGSMASSAKSRVEEQLKSSALQSALSSQFHRGRPSQQSSFRRPSSSFSRSRPQSRSNKSRSSQGVSKPYRTFTPSRPHRGRGVRSRGQARGSRGGRANVLPQSSNRDF